MADIAPGNMSPEEYAQQQALSRQQQMATLLMQQGQQQPQGQMVSGRYVPTSFFQNLVPLANIAASQYVGNKADTEQAKLAQQIRQNRNQAEQKISDLAFGTPEVSTELAGPYAGNVPQPRAVTQDATKPDMVSALREINTNMYGAGKDLKPLIFKQMMPEPTTLEREWKAAQAQGYKGNINDFKNQMNDYQKQQLGIEKQKLGMEFAKLQNELGGGKLTETQGNATAFGLRAKEANTIANQLEGKGVTDTGLLRSTVAGAVGGTPFIGKNLENTANTLLNFTASDDQQATKQARQNFITAILRKESGAVIGDNEFRIEEEKYFPKINDSEKVIKQKQDARDLAIRALEIQAGPGAKFIKEAGTPKLSSDDQQALQWANSNPTDPRAKQIKQRLGQ